MTEKKRKSPGGSRGRDGGGSHRGRDKAEASKPGGEKPPRRKEWRAKEQGQTPRGGARDKRESVAGRASERPSFGKSRGEESKTRGRAPRELGENAGRRRDGAAFSSRRDDRPPRRREDEAREGGFKRKGGFAAGGSADRPSFAKRRSENCERAGSRRDESGFVTRRDDRPPRRREGEARDLGFERKGGFVAGGSGERPPFRKTRAQDAARAGEGRARPPREGGENAKFRGDRAVARRGEHQDEGFKRSRDFGAGSGERPSFAKWRREGEATSPDARAPRRTGDRGPRKYEAPTKDSAFEGERIAKAMARAGACSRRDAEQWIADGRVSVNGRKLTSPAFNVREGDSIEVDGAPIEKRERTRLFLFHKPPGLVTSAKDPEGRKTVFEHVKELEPDLPRLMSVGRLDINTQGLLLLSNDGGLARALELPATGWRRRYRVRAHGETSQAALDQLAKGVEIEGVAYAPIEAKIERQQGTNVWIAMTLVEGKNREVKRVLAHLGLEVTRLIRVSFGPFQLGELDEGAIEEVRLKVLREQLGKAIAEFAGVDFSSPLRELKSPAKQEEARAAAASRPRKHVSVLRRERASQEDGAPRARIERAMTADRKGRAVEVERVVVKGEKPVASSRNARRFAAQRNETKNETKTNSRETKKSSPKSPRRDPKKPR